MVFNLQRVAWFSTTVTHLKFFDKKKLKSAPFFLSHTYPFDTQTYVSLDTNVYRCFLFNWCV